ncbi:MAG: hypothetical protein M1376_13760 [Planctomycetes bacterium]|nr:hypothetical protein [Planctomycetota bacterium]
MQARVWVSVVLIGAAAGLVASCSHRQKEAGISYAAWVPPGSIPPTLRQIGARAVNIIDLAAVGAWPQVYADVRDINNAWSGYKHPTVEPPSDPHFPDTLLYGPLDAAIARLRNAATARNATETMAAANDVSAAAFELNEYYNPSVPPGLARLAMLERKILLDTWDGRIDTAPDTMIEVHRTWQRVRPAVVARSSERVAEAFDSNLADQQAALDVLESEQVGDCAQNALLMLNEMEQLSY